MKRLKNDFSGNVNFAIFRGDELLNRWFSRACFGQSIKECKWKENMKVHLHFALGELQYNIYDIDYWTRFMTESGFPCKLTDTYFVDDKRDREYITLEILVDDYLNYTHLFAGLTAIRYVGYSFAGYIPEIPEVAAEIKLMFPDEESFNCLMLAHFPVVTGYLDSDHTIPANTGYKLIGKDAMLEQMKVTKSVNSACSPIKTEKSFNDIHKLTKERTKEAYEKAFQILK